MIPFEPSFFETEIRWEFEVDTTMKTCWAAEMEVLFEIDAICEKYDLQYFVYFGTLLGAIRHKGYVPWDDDIDIAMKREDFVKLMSVLKDELPEGYVVHNPLTGENASEFWASVQNSDAISIEPERLERYHGCPFVVGIDIFQLDYLPRDKEKEEELAKLFHMVWSTVRLAKRTEKSDEEEQNLMILLDEIDRVCSKQYGVVIDRIDNQKTISGLVVLANKIASSVKEEDADEMVTFISYEKNSEKRNPKEFFDEVEWVPFENIFVPVPASWEKLLPRIYKNYMTPRKLTQKHDYPLYKAQLESLKEIYQQKMGESYQ